MDGLGNAGPACWEKVIAVIVEIKWKILYDELS
jgi:hypothetical protein